VGERIVEVGTDFQASPLEALSRARIVDIHAFLDRIRNGPVAEIALLSTCNRFELYAATNEPENGLSALETEVRDLLGGNGDVELVVRRDDEAVGHLVAVAAGLESALVGEHEILGQVRRAHAIAAEAGTAGRTLGRLFEYASRHGRRIRRALGIAGLRRSLTDLAADWIRAHVPAPERRAAVVVGAGETASQMAQHLRGLDFGTLVVVNRSFARSRELAEDLGARAERFDRLPGLLRDADLVVLATSAPEPVLTEASLRAARRGRLGQLAVVDLGLSLNAEPAISKHPSVTVLTLSDVLALAVAESKREREQGARAEAMIREAVEDFRSLNAAQAGGSIARAASTV